MTTKITYMGSKSIAILMSIPLIDNEKPFSLFKATPMPLKIDHAFYDDGKPFFKEIVVKNRFIAMNYDLDRHIHF